MLLRFYLYLSLLIACPTLSGQSVITLRDFVIEGNDKTKEWLIIRESGYVPGYEMLQEDQDAVLHEIKQNISNLQLFVEVTVTALPISELEFLVMVNVIERWYLYPIPYFQLAEPNFNTWLRNRKESRTNYGIRFKQYNFRGRDERLEWTFQAGYSRVLGLRYTNPYLIPDKNWGIQVSAAYKEFGEVTVGTINNERIFYEGDRPDTRKEQHYSMGTSFRPDIFTENVFTLSYQNIQVAEGVPEETGEHLIEDGRRMRYFTLGYAFDFTDVDRRGYPLDGEHFSFEVSKIGLGVMDDSPTALRSSATMRWYRPLKGRFYHQHLVKGQATLFEDLPYYLQDGLGYRNNSVRSYEYYIMDSQYYLLNRNNLKFALVPESNFNLPEPGGLPFSRVSFGIHLNLIADLGYAGDRLYADANGLNNELLFGTGLGLDIVTNYDVVIRMEYTVNKLGESGFFLHYKKSI